MMMMRLLIDEIQQGVEFISKKKSDEGSITRDDGLDNVGNGERVQEDRRQIQLSSSSLVGSVEDI